MKYFAKINSIDKDKKNMQLRTNVRIIFFSISFICQMLSLDELICRHIQQEWIEPWSGSLRSFATEHDIDEKIVRKILNYKKTPYQISLSTLEKICRARNLTLELFFKHIGR